MGVLSTVLMVLFIIVCIITILLVLLQNDEGDSIGGLFAGSSSSAFGAHSSNILAKITRVAVFSFFVLVLLITFVQRSSDSSFQKEVQEQQLDSATEWWKEGEESNKDESSETSETEKSTEDSTEESDSSGK